MNELNKQFSYKDYKFNIKVELNYRAEKKFDGKKYHRVTVNCLGHDNYYETDFIETHQLNDDYFKLLEGGAINYVINKNKPTSTEQDLLLKLGFK